MSIEINEVLLTPAPFHQIPDGGAFLVHGSLLQAIEITLRNVPKFEDLFLLCQGDQFFTFPCPDKDLIPLSCLFPAFGETR